jgi:O-antigen/teichoic acid export membrane protein
MVDLIGWSGAILLLIAYALVSGKYVGGTSVGYQLLNIVGAVFLIVNSSYYGAYPSAILNLIWAAIALIAIIRKRKSGVVIKKDVA